MTNKETLRFEIFELLVSSKQRMSLSEIARRLRVTQQSVAYHLPLLVRDGLILREGDSYFCQPIFLDEGLNEFCAAKLAEIVTKFGETGEIFVEEGGDRVSVVMHCLDALITLNLDLN